MCPCASSLPNLSAGFHLKVGERPDASAGTVADGYLRHTGTMTEVVAEATPQTAANHGMPPGRVRHMFKTLDTDGNGTLSLEELKKGFAKDFKVDALAPHVRAAEGSNQPTRGTAPQTPSALSSSQNMLHPVHPYRRWWPAWRRCSTSTPTRRTERRRPSPSPHVAITMGCPHVAITRWAALT